jgi:hypothetical protein
MERTVERDPWNAIWRGVLASHLTHARQYDRAIEQAAEALKFDATHFVLLQSGGGVRLYGALAGGYCRP